MTAATVPPTRRVDRGRGHTYLLDGEKAPGVTTIVREGIPKPAFINKAAETTAGYAIDHWDELTELPVSMRMKALMGARWEALRKASTRGTDVHKLAHRLAAGEEVDVPEPLEGFVDAYLRFTEEWQPVELLVEVVVLNRRHRYMGTLDLIAGLADGKRWLLDWKTTASGVWPESALQLAGYRYAESYIDGSGEEQPMLEVDAAGVVWLRADGYDLVPVETGPDVFRKFLYAQQVAAFTGLPREALIGEALQPPEASR